MKFSDRLLRETKNIWDQAVEKPFVIGMAKGTLDTDLFKNYMIQDYLYLKDYIGILKQMLSMTEDAKLRSFLADTIKSTEYETYKVHMKNLRDLDIRDEDISNCKMKKVISDYVSYMNNQLKKQGIISGLTALLQCSWNYAYIADEIVHRYADELVASPYKSWFDAYTDSSYKKANDLWIKTLDDKVKNVDSDEVYKLCDVFRTCADYENKLWDCFWKK